MARLRSEAERRASRRGVSKDRAQEALAMRDGQTFLPLAAALILTMGLAACGGPKHRTTPIPERPAPQAVLNCPPGQTCDSGTVAPAGAKGSSTEEAIEDASAKSGTATTAKGGAASYGRASYR